MKSQLVILQLILVSCSLLATNATGHRQCDKLLHQCNHHCNQFRTQCTPDMMTLKSCCDLVSLQSLSKAPSAVYQIMTNCSCGSPYTAAVDVYCDMNTTDGGWMVIQRNRKDGVYSFHREWKDYEEGFGDLNGDKLWYGLKALNCFTETGQWELRIDFQFENKTWFHLHYKQFKVGNSSAEYPLMIGGFTGITTNDPFATHPLNGMKFSTVDNDNDGSILHYDKANNITFNCASHDDEGGWWYNICRHINPNRQPPYVYLNSELHDLLSVEMKMRQLDCIIQ